jgi:ubiquitin-conjugating enzyme (huntingtin interacting protein 2)
LVSHPETNQEDHSVDEELSPCLDILKSSWSPVLTLKSTLISLQSLLTDPQADDPQDAQGKSNADDGRYILTFRRFLVAGHYKRDKRSFDETAKQWAIQYAGAPGDSPANDANGSTQKSKAEQAGLSEANVAKFVACGFEEDKVSRSVDSLFGHCLTER